MRERARLNTYYSLCFILVASGTALLLITYLPPDAQDIRAAPELAAILGCFFPGTLVGAAVARILTTIGTPWVNHAVNPTILAYASGVGAVGYACYLLGTLNPEGLAWAMVLTIYTFVATLPAGLLLFLASLTPLAHALGRPIFGDSIYLRHD
jgi:hypothetical protein